MGLLRQIAPIQDANVDSCVTIGTFDGVHKGHQSLLRRLGDLANVERLRSVALEFPSTATFRHRSPSQTAAALRPRDPRIVYARVGHVDTVRLIEFDDAIRVMSAEGFLMTLRRSLGMRHLVIGERAVLGHDLLNVARIDEIAKNNGFELHTVPPVLLGDVVVSSSSIRKALSDGNVKLAANMLGRLYERGGHVYRGSARAREMGVPTANMEWSRELVMPAKGIYATWAKLPDGRVLPSATYIGDNPTLGGNRGTFEVHINDFDENLYGTDISVEFIEFIRRDQEFETPDELNKAIQSDVQRIAEVFATLQLPPNILIPETRRAKHDHHPFRQRSRRPQMARRTVRCNAREQRISSVNAPDHLLQRLRSDRRHAAHRELGPFDVHRTPPALRSHPHSHPRRRHRHDRRPERTHRRARLTHSRRNRRQRRKHPRPVWNNS